MVKITHGRKKRKKALKSSFRQSMDKLTRKTEVNMTCSVDNHISRMRGRDVNS